MRAMDFLRMEPDIALERHFECQQIVLGVVLSGKDIESVGRPVVERFALHRLCLTSLFLVLLGGEVSGADELLLDLCQVGHIFRLADALEHALQIG